MRHVNTVMFVNSSSSVFIFNELSSFRVNKDNRRHGHNTETKQLCQGKHTRRNKTTKGAHRSSTWPSTLLSNYHVVGDVECLWRGWWLILKLGQRLK